MEKRQVSAAARRLIAYRIENGETAARVAEDFRISEAEVERIAVSCYDA